MPDGIHGDQRPSIEVSARHIHGGEQLLAHVAWQHCLGPELDHAGGRQAPDSEQGAEVQVLGEDGLPMPVRLIEDHTVGGVGLTDVHRLDGVMTCCCEEIDPPRAEVHVDEEPHAEIGISISSTRQAAYARACITSCSSR